ncbi:tetratricopeptide repeat protein [Ectopseudomonas toyotomiensis]|uniref:tetratricopeptide repeat protein n=1 Tax=Ectopseudomonas toyotomiensis TaxID=554344 RepID=UPI003D13FF71
MFFRSFIFSALATLLCFSAWAAPLTPEQQAAKEKGIALYNQYKDAEPYLRIAAEAGDPEAQYYLGEDIRSANRFMTEEAHNWFVAAADQGDLYAMLRLSRSGNDLCSAMSNCPPDSKTAWDWLKQAREIGKARADAGDSEAMYIMYLGTNDLEWLEKSADAGYAPAQYLLASRYQEGKGFFFPPWKRSEKVEELAKKSAEGDFAAGIFLYQQFLEGDDTAIRYWTEKAVNLGSAEAIYGYGAFLAHEPEQYGFPLDLIKAYGFIYMLKDLDGGGGMQENVEYKLPKIASKMTPEQIEQAKVFAEEWKATHPPLSFFPPKLGF